MNEKPKQEDPIKNNKNPETVRNYNQSTIGETFLNDIYPT